MLILTGAALLAALCLAILGAGLEGAARAAGAGSAFRAQEKGRVRRAVEPVRAPEAPGEVAQQGEWFRECVDCPKLFSYMTDRSLRLDASGNPHIAYGSDYLYYAWHDGVDWQYETVDMQPGPGSHAALFLDTQGYPHISYLNVGYEFLKYAYQDASGWHLEEVSAGELSSTGFICHRMAADCM